MERVEIVVNLPVKGADRSFSYIVPTPLRETMQPGHLVRVPFGKRFVHGLVVGEAEIGAGKGLELKEIEKLVFREPSVPPDLLALARWLSRRYLCYLPQAYRVMLPPGLWEGKGPRESAWVELAVKPEEIGRFLPRLGEKAVLALMALAEAADGIARKDFLALGVNGKRIVAWQEAGLLRVSSRFQARDSLGGKAYPATGPLPLTEEQTAVLQRTEELMSVGGEVILLHGVTGSGKTEIYLQAIARSLLAGRGAMVLVPEISLTPQAVQRFVGRFGKRVAVLHSRLSDGERRDEWWRIRTGEADVVLGTRSAVFAPLSKPGLIILDEEHEPSYKQEDHPQYHAREVAERRAKETGATLLLGSATPSLETYSRAKNKTISIVKLTARVNGSQPPRPLLVDMRRELATGNRGIFSRTLRESMAENLVGGKQTILFINRRGVAGFVLCRDCGESVGCPNCAVSLALHEGGGSLLCHHCGHRVRLPPACPRCGGRALRPFAAGTERVEREVHLLFPEARTVRLDLDTVRKKGSYAVVLEAFGAGNADVLIGTQMVAKGLDFPEVTLVGVIAADISLNLPDFRAPERTFQLLCQVSGRSGRGEGRGRAIIQTYNPENYAIRAAVDGDFEGFYAEESRRRQELAYPPWTNLLLVEVQGAPEGEVAAVAARIAPCFRSDDGRILVTGPAPAPIARLRGLYRYRIMIRGPGEEIRERAQAGLKLAQAALPKAISLRLAVDPQQLG